MHVPRRSQNLVGLADDKYGARSKQHQQQQQQQQQHRLSYVCFKSLWCTATTQPAILSELLCILGAEGCVVDVQT